MVANPDFDLYRPAEEHEELRTAIRALSEKEIEPHAADVDENERFPAGGPRCAQRLGLQCGPRAGGVRRAGRGLRGGVHRHRGGRPRLRLVLPHPGREQARHQGPDPGQWREAQEAGPAGDRRGQDGLLRAVGAGGRLGCGGHAHPRKARRRQLGPQRQQGVDHQRRQVHLVHRHGRD